MDRLLLFRLPLLRERDFDDLIGFSAGLVLDASSDPIGAPCAAFVCRI
jgi:hypothetical protein